MDDDPSAVIIEAQTHPLLYKRGLTRLLTLEVEDAGQVAVPVGELLIELGNYGLHLRPGFLHRYRGVKLHKD